MSWAKFSIECAGNEAEQIADLLHERGALSVALEDAGNQPLFQLAPEQTPLWQATKVIALFDPKVIVDDIIEALQQQLQTTPIQYTLETLTEKNWEHETQKNFPPQCFANRLWVLPSWCDPTNYAGVLVKIDPGLAFGTGTHPTTALCLEWLATNPITNKTVIDYGCGSGILALGALAMGAKQVYATDHDPQALQATRSNAKLNDFGKAQLHAVTVDKMPAIKAPVIVANLLSQPLIELAPTLAALADNNATLVLSGLLTPEIDNVVTAYAKNFFQAVSLKTKEEWACLVLNSAR